VITWDADDFSDQGEPGTGCCGADPGGGHVVTVVITSFVPFDQFSGSQPVRYLFVTPAFG
jgi:hypothetical protein